MSAAASDGIRDANSVRVPARGLRLFRVGVLLIAGLVIAFTATEHERLGFDLVVVMGALAMIGVAHLLEWFAARVGLRGPLGLLLGLSAVAAAALLPTATSPFGFAVIVAAWALVSALLEFIGAARFAGGRQDAMLLGVLGAALAVFVLLVREDQVAIVGFFGGYAVIAGVFLGISAFDGKRVQPVTAASGQPSGQPLGETSGQPGEGTR